MLKICKWLGTTFLSHRNWATGGDKLQYVKNAIVLFEDEPLRVLKGSSIADIIQMESFDPIYYNTSHNYAQEGIIPTWPRSMHSSKMSDVFIDISKATSFNRTLCVVVNSNLFSHGEWFLVDCYEKLKFPLIICERDIEIKQHVDIRKIVRRQKECLAYEVLFNGVCLHTVYAKSLNTDCLEPMHNDTNWQIYYFTESLESFLTKITSGQTNQIGYHANDTEKSCFNKKCFECADQDFQQWTIGILCDDFLFHICRRKEKQIVLNCLPSQFQCNDGTCILNQYLCDGIGDCLDTSDEHNCSHICTSEENCLTYCPLHTCQCSMFYKQINQLCVPLYKWYSYNYANIISNTEITLRFERINDINIDTHDACPRRWSKCSTESMHCFPNDKFCIFERNIYGDPLYCTNTGNLQSCKTFNCPSMFRCGTSYCIPIHMVCDGVEDCASGSDEASCDRKVCPGLFLCRADNTCVHPNNICDGIVHCLLSHDDEFLCSPLDSQTRVTNQYCPTDCTCIGLTAACLILSRDKTISRISLNAHIHGLFIVLGNIQMDSLKTFTHLNLLNISNVPLAEVNYVINTISLLKSLIMINNSITVFPRAFLNNLVHLNELIILSNDIHTLPSHTFSGLKSLIILNLTGLHINVIEDCAFCDMYSLKTIDLSKNNLFVIMESSLRVLHDIDAIIISNNDIKYIETDALTVNQDHNVIITDDIRHCCFTKYRYSCTTPFKHEQVDCRELLVNHVLFSIVCIATICMLACSAYAIKMNLQFKNSHSLLIQNLNLADLIFTWYLLVLLIMHSFYGDQLVLQRNKWLVSFVCKTSTVLFILSVMQSRCLYLLIMINCLLVTKYALRLEPISKGQVTLLLTITWLLALGVAGMLNITAWC